MSAFRTTESAGEPDITTKNSEDDNLWVCTNQLSGADLAQLFNLWQDHPV
jgi:hypothetical protein